MNPVAQAVEEIKTAEKRVRVYTDLSLCGASGKDSSALMEDRAVVSLVSANWNKLSAEERRRKFGYRVGVIEPVGTMQEADVCILPKAWDYYVRSGKVGEAVLFARRAAECGKEVVIWYGGDLEAVIPVPNAMTFSHGPHRSLKRVYRKSFAIPQFKEDWLQLYYGGKEQARTWKPVPSVGFCGWASGWNGRTLTRGVCTLLHQAWHKAGVARYVPPSFPPAVLLRMKILRILAADARLQTQFIVRDRYRGGTRGGEARNPQAKAKLEFVGNIWESDYTVCARGVGNFSSRLYETLSLGRIPIFVNTDCVLPYDLKVNYKDCCVWIEEDGIRDMPGRLLEFHSKLTPAGFVDLQHRCRRLWEDYLSVDGFYRHFGGHFWQDDITFS